MSSGLSLQQVLTDPRFSVVGFMDQSFEEKQDKQSL